MTLLDEAVARYHRLLDSEHYKDLGWAQALQEEMRKRRLAPDGRLVCPVLRPHLITRRQYDSAVKGAESLYSAIDRVRRAVIANPSMLARLELLPAEKMLAAIDPGYPHLSVNSQIDTQVNNGSMHVMECGAASPAGVIYGETLSEIFYDSPPVRELRKRYKLTRVGGMKYLLKSLLDVYKVFGKKKYPSIAILEFRQPFQNAPSAENELLAESFRRAGYPSEVVTPEQLDYRNGVLRRGEFAIDLVFRRVSAQELLVRFDLTHPLVRAYRERTVCLVNSFQAELAHKKAIFALLTDEAVTARFPAAERKAIRDHIPWTRVVAATKTTRGDGLVDLPEFILKNRERLVMKPNTPSTDLHEYHGWETNDTGWERALRAAMRHPYVVQDRVEESRSVFPMLQGGRLALREMEVDLRQHLYLGKVHGCSSWLRDAAAGFSTIAGLAPTFIAEGK
jgi:uncharacterized circularly permuted ATP-grasp superfamily protein